MKAIAAIFLILIIASSVSASPRNISSAYCSLPDEATRTVLRVCKITSSSKTFIQIKYPNKPTHNFEIQMPTRFGQTLAYGEIQGMTKGSSPAGVIGELSRGSYLGILDIDLKTSKGVTFSGQLYELDIGERSDLEKEESE